MWRRNWCCRAESDIVNDYRLLIYRNQRYHPGIFQWRHKFIREYRSEFILQFNTYEFNYDPTDKPANAASARGCPQQCSQFAAFWKRRLRG